MSITRQAFDALVTHAIDGCQMPMGWRIDPRGARDRQWSLWSWTWRHATDEQMSAAWALYVTQHASGPLWWPSPGQLLRLVVDHSHEDAAAAWGRVVGWMRQHGATDAPWPVSAGTPPVLPSVRPRPRHDEEAAVREYDRILSVLSRHGTLWQCDERPAVDAAYHAGIRACGGWRELVRATDAGYLRRDFVAAYSAELEAQRRAELERDPPPMLGASERRRLEVLR